MGGLLAVCVCVQSNFIQRTHLFFILSTCHNGTRRWSKQQTTTRNWRTSCRTTRRWCVDSVHSDHVVDTNQLASPLLDDIGPMMPPPPSEAPPKKKRGTDSFLSPQCEPHLTCCLQFLHMKSCSCHTCPTPICMKEVICIEIRSITLPFHQSTYQTLSIQHGPLTTFLNSNDFIITTSVDGHLKFWKKTASGVEFVKHYRAHLGTIVGISLSADGELLATISEDQALKVFDVTNFGKERRYGWGREPCYCILT